MRIAYFDCFSGISGDMTIAAFLDAGLNFGKLSKELARLKLKKEHSEELYYLWDLRSVRNRYKDNELFFTADLLSTGQSFLRITRDELSVARGNGQFDGLGFHQRFIQ